MTIKTLEKAKYLQNKIREIKNKQNEFLLIENYFNNLKPRSELILCEDYQKREVSLKCNSSSVIQNIFKLLKSDFENQIKTLEKELEEL